MEDEGYMHATHGVQGGLEIPGHIRQTIHEK